MSDPLATLRAYTISAGGQSGPCGLASTNTQPTGIAQVDEANRNRFILSLPGASAITLAEGQEFTIAELPGRRFRVQGPQKLSNLRVNGAPLSRRYDVTEDR